MADENLTEPADHGNAALAAVERMLAQRALEFYEPYPKQMAFHESGKSFAERLLMAANQVGKCAAFDSFIDHPDGSRSTFGERYRAAKPFAVWGWSATRGLVETRAVTPIKKPAEPCVRLWFEDGRWFSCALNHRMLTAYGEYVFCGNLLASLPNLRASSSEFFPSVRAADDRRWTKIRRDFLRGCLNAFRLCDGQLHRAVSTVRGVLPSPSGVQVRGSVSCDTDAYYSKYNNILQQVSRRPSNQDGVVHLLGRCVASVDRAVYTSARRMTCCIQGAQRWLLGLILHLQRAPGEPEDRVSFSLRSPFKAENHIIAYETIESQEVYDFTVPETGNYVACGIVHHNTLAAGSETAFHLAGKYPDWWKGRRFARRVIGWTGSPTGQTSRDTVQRILLGRPGEWGTGTIPKDDLVNIKRAAGSVPDQVESITVRSVFGGESLIVLKSYDQGRIRWQGETVDFVWFDEEPPEDIYSEGKTRTQASKPHGVFVYMTFTPMLGMSGVVVRFLKEKPPGTSVTGMTIYDAGHYTPAEREVIIAGYPAHERDARAKGIPIMGSGRVFTIPEETLRIEPIAIPPHWYRGCGMDFGWDHPTANVWGAWDKDEDVFYIYAVHRQKETTPVVHAAAIKGKGAWIPVFWPHDGLQHDKGSGIQIAQQYRAQGVNMHRERSTHAPAPGKPEGSGGFGVEAGIVEMIDRMQTGRLKVFRTCTEWFEEYRMYHRKDGLIVKEGDDIMSATRIGIMMRRFAKVAPLPQRATAPKFVVTDPSMGVLGSLTLFLMSFLLY